MPSRRATIIDISNVNGDVDFHVVKRAGISGAWLKVSEGLDFNDGRYAQFRHDAAAAGVRIGGYHFARPDHHPYSPEAEADHFVRAIGLAVGRRDLKPVLDFETHSVSLSSAQMVAWARRFNQRVKQTLGVLPIFYTYPSFAEGLHPATPIGCGLWLASYSKNDGKEHAYSIPRPWKKTLAHQYTSRGTLVGHKGWIDFSHAPSIRSLLAHPIIGV